MTRHATPVLKNTTRHLGHLALAAALILLTAPCPAGAVEFHVSPAGRDDAAGTQEAPFATLSRARAAVREAAPKMDADIVVNLAPGVYRLDGTLELTEADSGRNGHRVIYRGAAGPGQARILGSVPLTGWQEHRDGIWKVHLPEGMTFNTLYEDGRRAWKARFPNYEHHPEMPTARGRYLVSADGMPRPKRDADPGEMKGPGWLIYPPEDEPPVLLGPKTNILIFPGGKYDWMRQTHRVMEIDREARRLTFAATTLRHGVGAGSRYFLEDDLALLDAPGEFFIDEAKSNATRAASMYSTPATTRWATANSITRYATRLPCAAIPATNTAPRYWSICRRPRATVSTICAYRVAGKTAATWARCTAPT